MGIRNETEKLRLVFTFSYLTQCLSWIFLVGYLTLIGPPALAVIAIFPTELSFTSQYFLYLSIFIASNSWVAAGLILWTGFSGAYLYPRLLALFPVEGFESAKQRFEAYASTLHSLFALFLAFFVLTLATESLLGPIDPTVDALFGSRFEFLAASWHYCWQTNWESLCH